MNFLSNEQKGIFYVLLSGLLYGLLGYFGMTVMAEGFSLYNMLFWRFVFAIIFMLPIILPEIKNCRDYKEIIKIFCFGAIFHGVSAIFYFISASYVGTGIGMVLFFLYPVAVILLNYLFYRIKITKTYYNSIFLILLGLMLIADFTNLQFDLFGIIMGILGAIFYAFYVVLSKKSKVSPTLSTFVMALGCAFISLISALFDDSFLFPTHSATWLNLAVMGVVSTALPVLFFLKGLQFIDAAKSSILGVSEPLAVMFFGYILLGEKMTMLQLMGAGMIMFGAVMVLDPLRVLRRRNKS